MRSWGPIVVLVLLASFVFGISNTDNISNVGARARAKAKISIIGSGNWGSAIGKIVAENARKRNAEVDSEVRMWVFEEYLDGRKLSEIINEEHENKLYLPGYPLPDNLLADSDLVHAISNATILIFVLPYEFLDGVVRTLQPHVHPDTVAVSLIKGVSFDNQGRPNLVSSLLKERLNISCVGVLMGANVAEDVASCHPCESTLAVENAEYADYIRDVFNSDSFAVNTMCGSDNVAAAELCGAIKNVIALGAGFCDGLGLSQSTKAAVIRRGVCEMRDLIQMLYPNTEDQIFFESCGIADVLVTSYSGRNRKCAEAFALSRGQEHWSDIEARLLSGQKLAGIRTASNVMVFIRNKGFGKRFSLFSRIHEIAFENRPVESIARW